MYKGAFRMEGLAVAPARGDTSGVSPPLTLGSESVVARVLIVDDDRAVRDVLVRVLERANHEVEACGRAVSALELSRRWNPDIVVTDVFMPEMDGIEFLLQVLEERPGLPIIVISGGAHSTSPHLALEDAAHLGAISTLTKPFEPDELRAAVNEALAGFRPE